METKWVGKSRAFTAMWMPVAALIIKQSGVDDGDTLLALISTVIEGVLGIGGIVAWYRHWRHPDERTVTLVPQIGAATGASGLVLLVALVGLAVGSPIGCAAVGKSTTPEAKFYEVDQNATAVWETVNDTLATWQPELSPGAADVLLSTEKTFGATREEVRRWLEVCGSDLKCQKQEKIAAGIGSMKATIDLVEAIIAEVMTDDE